jgi:signal transduction histidine kinase
MLHEFLDTHRIELIDRCRGKVALRTTRHAGSLHMEHGIPLFLGQLIAMLRSEDAGLDRIAANDASGASMDSGAASHGGELLREGYNVEQVVRDYGDLCQAITELAIERHAVVSATEFRTRCLDSAIAHAVTEYARGHDEHLAESSARELNERLGFLAHELRNFLNTAILSFAAIKSGSVAANGATSAVMDRSLLGLRDLIDRALADVRLTSGMPPELDLVALDRFMADVQVAGCLEARAKGCELVMAPVPEGLVIRADRQMLYSAVSNLLQNAFKFTHPDTEVRLAACARGGRVLIEVEDRCGGLGERNVEDLFANFKQYDGDRSGLGLGLSIARRAVEASGGRLTARSLPGVGCVFTVDLPQALRATVEAPGDVHSGGPLAAGRFRPDESIAMGRTRPGRVAVLAGEGHPAIAQDLGHEVPMALDARRPGTAGGAGQPHQKVLPVAREGTTSASSGRGPPPNCRSWRVHERRFAMPPCLSQRSPHSPHWKAACPG